jgi:hypothetical protein
MSRSSRVKTDAAVASQMSVNLYQTTQPHLQENCTLPIYQRQYNNYCKFADISSASNVKVVSVKEGTRSGGIAPHILNLDTKWMTSFRLRPFKLRAKCPSPRYVLNSKVGGSQSRSAQLETDKCLLPLPGLEPRFLSCPVRILITTPTELSRLSAYVLFKTSINPVSTRTVYKLPFATCYIAASEIALRIVQDACFALPSIKLSRS